MTYYTNPSRSLQSSEFEVDKQLISRFVVEKLLPWLNKPYPLDELMLMTAAICRFSPDIILEWGTNVGYSARIFYEIVKSFEMKSEIHTIDLPDNVTHPEHNPQYRGIEIKNISDIKMHCGDGLDTSLEIIKQKKVTGNIMFFIDGDHRYDSVKRELNAALAVTKSVILLHDTLFQSEDSGYNCEPYLAIRDILATKTEYKWITMNIGGPGMSLIYHPSTLRK